MGIRVMWSDMPSEILELIASLLLKNTITDLVSFGAVCKSWQSVALQMPISLRTQIPWLVLYSHKESRFSFFSFFKNQTFYLDQPLDSHRRFCAGSCRGWLFMVDEESSTSLLVNPITRAQLVVPAITALPSVVSYPPCNERDKNHLRYVFKMPSERICSAIVHPNDYVIATEWVKKIALSLDPSLDNKKSCVMMCISYGFKGLIVCKPGDTTWTTVEDKDCNYSDLAYWNGEFYAVDDRGSIVVVCDLDASPTAKQISSPTTLTPPTVFERGVYHLVESSGELLLVRRHSKLFELKPTNVDVNSVSCQVFRRDPFKQEWFEVKALDNHTLFLSHQSSVSLLSSSYPGLGGNRIYFVNPQSKYKCGMYNLEDDTFEPFYTTNYEEMRKAVWITPSIW